MYENVIKFTAKVDEKVSYWFLENGTPIDAAERMCMQFIQMLGQIKAAQAAMQQKEQESVPKEDDSVSENQVCSPCEG